MGSKPDKPSDPKDPSGLLCVPGVIFDRTSVQSAIELAALEAEDGRNLRPVIAGILKQANEQGRATLKATYLQAPYQTNSLIRSYAYLTDAIVLTAFEAACQWFHPLAMPTKSERLAIVAVGGYGRAEMAPFSDVDLLFLTPYKLTAWSESVIETVLYILWDARLKVGHATRSVEDCLRLAKEDQTIRTALLENRYLGGDRKLAEKLDERLWSEVFAGTEAEFVELKLEEREARHKRQGGQRYMLEPNVKEGKGGLRDLQTLFWITKYINRAKTVADMIADGMFSQDEYERFAQAEEFLWTVRCHLHLLSGRATEQLSFDYQVDVAKALGFHDDDGLLAVEAFMQVYFRHATHVGELTRVFLTALEAKHVKKQPGFGHKLIRAMRWNKPHISRGYQMLNGRLAIKGKKSFSKDPVNILRLFEEGLRSAILIHPDAMRLVTANLDLITDEVRNDPEAKRIFLDLMLAYDNPERALRRMNELGVLGAFIPEFQRIVAMMQFNMYHHYTVDEHTIQCISNLAKIEQGELTDDLPVSSEILKSGLNRRVLYVALLLHDIGKGLPEDHSISGAKIAYTVAPRLGLTPEESDTVVWLVRHHLLMSDVAQKRDLSDRRTVRDFADIVETKERLQFLTVLTVCDIRGVGPSTWNNWKAQLLRQLYRETDAFLGESTTDIAQPELEAKAALRMALADWSEETLNTEINRHYDPYWQGLDADTQIVFAHLLRQAEPDLVSIEITADPDRDATRACFVIGDNPGVFSRLAGALALVGANVMDARTYTSSDGFATSVFWVQDIEGKPFEPSRLDRLRRMITQTLKGEVAAKEELRSRDKIKKSERKFIVPTKITFDNEGSEIYTIIEVDTRDRPGLLYDLTRTLNASNIYIASAVIATYGAQAVDSFYVKDMFGLKLHSPTKRQSLEKKLLESIEQGAEEALA